MESGCRRSWLCRMMTLPSDCFLVSLLLQIQIRQGEGGGGFYLIQYTGFYSRDCHWQGMAMLADSLERDTQHSGLTKRRPAWEVQGDWHCGRARSAWDWDEWGILQCVGERGSFQKWREEHRPVLVPNHRVKVSAAALFIAQGTAHHVGNGLEEDVHLMWTTSMAILVIFYFY